MLLLDHKDFEGALDMPEAVLLVEDAHRAWGQEPNLNHPRRMLDVVHPGENRRVRLNSFLGAWPRGGYMGAQLQMHAPVMQEQQQGLAHIATDVYALYSSDNGALLAIFYGGSVRPAQGGFRGTTELARHPIFGEIATAAIGAVGTKALAREDASTLGFFGTGSFAPGHLLAVASVRQFDQIKVYSRTKEHRERFCKEMSEVLEKDVIPVNSPEDCVRGSDVVMCVTNSDEPVLSGDHLDAGAHVTSIVASSHAGPGGVLVGRTELDDRTLERANRIAVVSKEQAITDQHAATWGAAQRNVISMEDICELGPILAGSEPGRTSQSDITVFHQNSRQGVSCVPIAARYYEIALERGIGTVADL